MPSWMYNLPNGSIFGLVTAFMLVFGAGRTYWVSTVTYDQVAPRELQKLNADQRRLMRLTIARSMFMLATAGAVGWPSLFTLWNRDYMIDAYINLEPSFAGPLEFNLAIAGVIGTLLIIARGVMLHKPNLVLAGLVLACGAMAGLADLCMFTSAIDQWALVNTFAHLGAGAIVLLLTIMAVRGLIIDKLHERDAQHQKLGAETSQLGTDKIPVI